MLSGAEQPNPRKRVYWFASGPATEAGPLMARIRAYGPPPAVPPAVRPAWIPPAPSRKPEAARSGAAADVRRIGVLLTVMPLAGLLVLWTNDRVGREARVVVTAVTVFWMALLGAVALALVARLA
jgi:hypothetical protein